VWICTAGPKSVKSPIRIRQTSSTHRRLACGVEVLAEITSAAASRNELGIERVVHLACQHLLAFRRHSQDGITRGTNGETPLCQPNLPYTAQQRTLSARQFVSVDERTPRRILGRVIQEEPSHVDAGA